MTTQTESKTKSDSEIGRIKSKTKHEKKDKAFKFVLFQPFFYLKSCFSALYIQTVTKVLNTF